MSGKLTDYERGILHALNAGHEITYSQDGDNAWLHPAHPSGILIDTAVINLRALGYIKKEKGWENDTRFGPHDVITEAGRQALAQPTPGTGGTTNEEPKK